MRTLSQKLEGAKRYVKHPDYKVGIDMLDEFITDAEKLEAQVKNLDLHSVNHRVCANCYHHHHNHFESDYCGLNGNIIKNIYDHTCNVFITKMEWLRKHGG